VSKTYSIKDLENLTGIKAHTIRIWEQRYQIITPERTDTNIRYYNSEDLKHMLNVSMLNANGYKISAIAKLSRLEVCQKVIETIDKNVNYNDQINGLTIAMVELSEEQFEKIISTNILKFGFEKTMMNIIYPFLTKVGFLWQTDSINPAQEHFITNLIRQKLIVAIDSIYVPKEKIKKKYVLYLPSGELHEISLLFAAYIIKSRQNKVYYLGQNLPTSDLKLACDIHKPDYVVTSMTTAPKKETTEEYLHNTAKLLPNVQILVSGYQVIGQDLKLPDNVKVINHYHQLTDMLSENIMDENESLFSDLKQY
jgi:DNA-binding transcriptional MerR regulator